MTFHKNLECRWTRKIFQQLRLCQCRSSTIRTERNLIKNWLRWKSVEKTFYSYQLLIPLWKIPRNGSFYHRRIFLDIRSITWRFSWFIFSRSMWRQAKIYAQCVIPSHSSSLQNGYTAVLENLSRGRMRQRQVVDSAFCFTFETWASPKNVVVKENGRNCPMMPTASSCSLYWYFSSFEPTKKSWWNLDQII